MPATDKTTDFVTINVPAYNGEKEITRALESVRRQTHSNFKALISVDRSTDRTADACRPFLEDPRFQLVEQDRHLGWVDNCSWLLERVDTELSFLLPHDDVIEDRYLETLLAGAKNNSAAAVVYSDIITVGRPRKERIVQHSIRGARFTRILTYLVEHYNGVAWRGLIRSNALAAAGPMNHNEADDFAAETAWLLRLLKEGEFVRVAEPLYTKHYREGSVHDRWMDRNLEEKMHAWKVHCLQVAREALEENLPAGQKSIIIQALVFRLMRANPILGPFPEITTLEQPERERLLDGFLSGLADILGPEEARSLVPDRRLLSHSRGPEEKNPGAGLP